MNSSLWSADRMTHIKIITVSLAMTAVVVVAVGSGIRATNLKSDSARNYVDPRPVVAGQPVSLSATDSPTIR
jgi:hypothetical protein